MNKGNLIAIACLAVNSIPRDPSGTNIWVDTNGISAFNTLFYRPFIYAPTH